MEDIMWEVFQKVDEAKFTRQELTSFMANVVYETTDGNLLMAGAMIRQMKESFDNNAKLLEQDGEVEVKGTKIILP